MLYRTSETLAPGFDSLELTKAVLWRSRGSWFNQENLPSKGDDHPNGSLDDPRDVVKFMSW